ncbi:TPA: hypothetical protein ACPVYE_004650 [Vibrio parahaemolyticus]
MSKYNERFDEQNGEVVTLKVKRKVANQVRKNAVERGKKPNEYANEAISRKAAEMASE